MAETPALWQVRQVTLYPELFFSQLPPPEVQGKHVSLPQDLLFRGSAFETLLFFSPALSFTTMGIPVTPLPSAEILHGVRTHERDHHPV